MYKRQVERSVMVADSRSDAPFGDQLLGSHRVITFERLVLSLIHISEPTRPY